MFSPDSCLYLPFHLTRTRVDIARRDRRVKPEQAKVDTCTRTSWLDVSIWKAVDHSLHPDDCVASRTRIHQTSADFIGLLPTGSIPPKASRWLFILLSLASADCPSC